MRPLGRDDFSAGVEDEGRGTKAAARRRNAGLRGRWKVGRAVIGLVAATANGRRRAAHLAEVWEDARLYEGKPREALVAAWKECEGIVLFLATGATIRLVAPLLEDKRRDPGVARGDGARE